MTDPTLRSQLAALGVYREAVSLAVMMCARPGSPEKVVAEAIIAAALEQDTAKLRAAIQSGIDQCLSTGKWRLWAADLISYLGSFDTEAEHA